MLFRSGFCAALLATGLLMPALGHADDPSIAAQAVADRWDQSFNAGDMDTLTKLYSVDAEVITKGAPVSGAQNIQAYFANQKAKGFADHKITVQSSKTRNDIMIVSGRWEASGPGEGGARKMFNGNWVNVMERRGDDWRTVLHTWN